MDKWVENYRRQAERALELGYVREVDFSGSTYQVEVYDPETDQSRWPFLQFDEQGRLKDAFCSCPAEGQKCLHLATAYLKILGPNLKPLHIRFENSFWNHLCRLFGDYTGYDERALQKRSDGEYFFQNEGRLAIIANTKEAELQLTQLIEMRRRETPENSIKFSNFSQEEIVRWREGRPSPSLRYSLSFWSDFARWIMHLTDESKISIQENQEGYPTLFRLSFPTFQVDCEIKKKDLPKLIPYLGSVNSPLLVFQSSEEKVQNITFDPAAVAFHIEHTDIETADLSKNTLQLEGWAYVRGVGFYSTNGESLLSRSLITKEDVPQFLEQLHQQIAKYIPI